MKKPAQVSELTEFLRTYYAETAGHTSARIAYLRAEAWHFRIYDTKRFKNYETFKASKSRFLKRNRLQASVSHAPKMAAIDQPQEPLPMAAADMMALHFDLFNQVLIKYIALSELRDYYLEQWAGIKKTGYTPG